MTITEIIAWGVLGLLGVSTILEALDFWLNERISEAVKEWWNR